MAGATAPPTLRIGVTGPIGCGKSTVASWLAEHDGVEWIDADRVAHDVLEPGTPELDAVYRRFGADLRRADGRLDRAGLAAIVFADPGALAALESIVHPAVRPRIIAALGDAEARGVDVVVVEAIKLVEGGLAALCDEVWLIDCDPATQRARLAARGGTPGDAATRVAAQGDLRDRLRPAVDRVIDTSGALASTIAAVQTALAEALARRPANPRA
jgi:dephospho-CoA kinase